MSNCLRNDIAEQPSYVLWAGSIASCTCIAMQISKAMQPPLFQDTCAMRPAQAAQERNEGGFTSNWCTRMSRWIFSLRRGTVDMTSRNCSGSDRSSGGPEYFCSAFVSSSFGAICTPPIHETQENSRRNFTKEGKSLLLSDLSEHTGQRLQLQGPIGLC